MRIEQHLQLAQDYAGRAGTGQEAVEFALLASMHYAAATALRGQASEAAETTIIPAVKDGIAPPVEPWNYEDGQGFWHAAWLVEDGTLHWTPVEDPGQPSWRRVYVERRIGL